MFVNEVRKRAEQGGRTHAAVAVAHAESSLKDIVDKLATTHHHRVFLVDLEHKPIGVVSVSDVCAVLADNVREKKAPPPVPKRGGAPVAAAAEAAAADTAQ